jgi:hypothetical protein
VKVSFYSTAGTLDDKPAGYRAYMGRPIRSVKIELNFRNEISGIVLAQLPRAPHRLFPIF